MRSRRYVLFASLLLAGLCFADRAPAQGEPATVTAALPATDDGASAARAAEPAAAAPAPSSRPLDAPLAPPGARLDAASAPRADLAASSRATDAPDEAASAWGPHLHDDLGVDVGFRGVVIANDGFDPFSEDDLLPGLALTATYLPLHVARMRLGATFEYDVSHRGATARGADSSLAVQRLSLGVLARVDVTERLYGFARVAPSALNAQASLTDAALDRPLVAEGWTWNVDTTGGAALLLSRPPAQGAGGVRFWLLAEAGYSFAGAVDLEMRPEEDPDDPRRFGAVRLPALRPSGFVQRVALALTF